MFQLRHSIVAIAFSALTALFSVVTVAAEVVSVLSKGDLADRVTALKAGESARSFEGAPQVFRVEVPTPGLLAVDVVTPSSATAKSELPEPRLDFVAWESARRKQQPVVIERSPNHWILSIREAGEYFFQVESQDLGATLGRTRFSSRFVSAVESLAFKDGEDEEVIEVEPDPFTATIPGAGPSLVAQLAAVCGAGEVDDHGDISTCATVLGANQSVHGEIRNGWGDDGDVFRLVVGDTGAKALWAVEIETRGSPLTVGILSDQDGRRIDVGSVGEAGFRIARALPAGTYFLRVEGLAGEEGPYRLNFKASP